MFGNFTEEARKILMDAKKEMKKLKHPYIGSEHLMLAILSDNNSVTSRLKDYDITYDTFKKELIKIVGIGTKESNYFLYTPLLKRVISNAVIDSKENNEGNITIEHLFSGLLEEGDGVAIRIMAGLKINLDKMYDDFSSKYIDKKQKGKKLYILQFGTDLNEKALNQESDPVIGREKELERLIEILSRRTKNNPILVGEAGTGKTALATELARRIVYGEVPLKLKNKRIINLDMATLVAGTKYRGEFEERIRKILKEVEENDDIILFIDEVHTLVGAGGAEGAIDASNIFKPALARGKIRCIGATTISEYKKFIEKDAALDRRFQKVYVNEPSMEMVHEILFKLKKYYESFHKVKMSDNIIELIITLSNKYIHDRNEPDKSIDILDEVCAKVSLKESKNLKKYNELNKQIKEIIDLKNKAIACSDFKVASTYKEQENNIMTKLNLLEIQLYNENSYKEVSEKDVAEVIHDRTKVPVYELLNDKKKVINNIAGEINSKIMGQEEACNKVINLIKRIKLGYGKNKCYALLFCGSSGIGKTSLAKIFGKQLVGEENVIKLDMSEFSESHSISKILGAPPGYVGYDYNNTILEEIYNKPNSVIILDEMEKAHPKVLDLFYQILDDGKIKDSQGRIIYFNNTIIVMTSNIGFENIKIGFNKENHNEIVNKLNEYFSISFINRIDDIIIFNKLDKEKIIKIINKKIDLLRKKYSNITITIDKKMITNVLNQSNYNEYGARKLDKIIEKEIENKIIDALIDNQKEIKILPIIKSKVLEI